MDLEANLNEQQQLSGEIIDLIDKNSDDNGVIPVSIQEQIVNKSERLSELCQAYCEFHKKKSH